MIQIAPTRRGHIIQFIHATLMIRLPTHSFEMKHTNGRVCHDAPIQIAYFSQTY